jgi:PAS domain S-box-containing protein
MGAAERRPQGSRRGWADEVAFDMEHDLICTADTDGRFTSLNAAWERVLGWTREELMARPFIEFVHPDDAERTKRAAASLTEPDREVAAFENRYRTRDGNFRWLTWSARSDGKTWFAVASDVTERKESERRLREAMLEDRLLAYSQPIVDRAGRVVQEELLVRLEDRDGTVQLPSEFLPEAERSGLIVEIDRWMSAQGLRLARSGRNVEVNLSSKSIQDDAFLAELSDAIRSAGVSARRLVFEITETTALHNPDATTEFAERLDRLGCLFALDDFGTGFGSLTHLRRLPIQMLKIDISFVRGIRDNAADRTLVRGVASIARELGMQTIAEGVEDAVTYRVLGDYGIDRAQGFLIARPSPVLGSRSVQDPTLGDEPPQREPRQQPVGRDDREQVQQGHQ